LSGVLKERLDYSLSFFLCVGNKQGGMLCL